MERRDLLALLGVGAATGAAGCSGLLGGGDGGEATPTATPTATPEPEGLSLEDVQRRERELASTASPDPTFSYDYGTLTVSDIPDPNFERVRAEATPDREGDRLRVTPGLVSADELAARLRAVWGVGEDAAVERQVGGATVTFAGGASGGTAYLVGAHPTAGEDGAVLVARAASLSTARALTRGFD